MDLKLIDGNNIAGRGITSKTSIYKTLPQTFSCLSSPPTPKPCSLQQNQKFIEDQEVEQYSKCVLLFFIYPAVFATISFLLPDFFPE